MALKINISITGPGWTIDGIPGEYRYIKDGGFTRIRYYKDNTAPGELVGNFAIPQPPAKYPKKDQDMIAAITKHATAINQTTNPN